MALAKTLQLWLLGNLAGKLAKVYERTSANHGLLRTRLVETRTSSSVITHISHTFGQVDFVVKPFFAPMFVRY